MSGYRWHCRTEGCDWRGVDAPAVLDHREKTGHIGARPLFGRNPFQARSRPVLPPAFRAPEESA